MKQQEINDLLAANFYKKYLQNFKYNVKMVCIFPLILVGIPSILILSLTNNEGGGGGGVNSLLNSYIYIYIYMYYILYGNHKTLISHHGCSHYLVITGQKEQTIFCITFLHSPSSDASFLTNNLSQFYINT